MYIPRSKLDEGTSTFSKVTSAWPCGAWSKPNTVSIRTTFTPDASMGTRIIDCCLYGGADGSVLPMKMAILQRGSPAPEVHHFRPLMTYSLPARRMLASMLVASEEATAGSVIAKQELISPASRGFRQRSFCFGLPES